MPVIETVLPGLHIGGVFAVTGNPVQVQQDVPGIDAGCSSSVVVMHGSSCVVHQFGYFIRFFRGISLCLVITFQKRPIDCILELDGDGLVQVAGLVHIPRPPCLPIYFPVLIAIVIHQLSEHRRWTPRQATFPQL